MKPSSEKEHLLSIASLEEWWKWADDPENYPGMCLLCQAYDDCDDCREAGGRSKSLSCWPLNLPGQEAAARRLIRAGIKRPKGV